MKPDVSIILPVYKVEAYLSDCVKSLTSQSFSNIEILLVDDGSPDRSGEIADELAATDSRIRVFHKNNEGVTRARAYGLSKALGDWIIFVDSDDSLPDDAVEFLYDKAVAHRYDLVLGNWLRVKPTEQRSGWLGRFGTLSGDDYLKALLSGDVPAGIWGKIFRKEILQNGAMNLPSDITNLEDLIMNIRVAREVKRAGVFPHKVVYNYYLRENSASQKRLSVKSWERIFEELGKAVPAKYESQYWGCVLGLMLSYGRDMDFSQSAYYLRCDDKRRYYSPLGEYRAKLRCLRSPSRMNRSVVILWSFFRKGKKLVICGLSRLAK